MKLRYKDGKVSQSMYSSSGSTEEPRWESKRKRKPVTYYDEEFDNISTKRPARPVTQSSQSEPVYHTHETRSSAMRTRYGERDSHAVATSQSRSSDTRAAFVMRTRGRQSSGNDSAAAEADYDDRIDRASRSAITSNDAYGVSNSSRMRTRRSSAHGESIPIVATRRPGLHDTEDGGAYSEEAVATRSSQRRNKRQSYASDSDRSEEHVVYPKRYVNRRNGRHNGRERIASAGSDSESENSDSSDAEIPQSSGTRMSLRSRRG